MPHFERNTRLSSRNLYHFTPSIDCLKGILRNGFRASESIESEIWRQEHFTLRSILEFLNQSETPESSVRISMVCFCDIPPKLSQTHRLNYGAYGIAMSKNWGIDSGVSPVHYVPKDTLSHFQLNGIFSIAERLKRQLEQDVGQGYYGDLYNLIRQIFESFQLIKPYISRDGLIKYYDEREWRFLAPSYFNYDNTDTYLKFSPSDIQEIVLPSNKAKKEIIRFINEIGVAIKPSKFKVRSLKKKIR